MLYRAALLLLIAGALALAFLKPAKADPLVAAEREGIRITVYTEKCEMGGVVTNLPNRATWVENGKTIEGCAQAFPQVGLVLFYFADKTVVPVPLQMFERVLGS